MHPDGGNLSRNFILRPDAGEAGNALRHHAQVTTGADEDFFQLADKIHRANARLKSAQIENGIADELAGTVKSHVAAAVGFIQLNPIGGKKLAGGDDVLRSAIAPESNYRRML